VRLREPPRAAGSAQVQAESATHADGLARVATRLEALGAEAEGTRALLAALQGAGQAPAPPASPWEEALRGVTSEAGRAEGGELERDAGRAAGRGGSPMPCPARPRRAV